jgi:hypothetical protein
VAGSAELWRLVEAISDIAHENLPSLLPVFYLNLDPVEVSTMLDRLDSST